MYIIFVLYPWRWEHGWPKHVGSKYVHKINFSISVNICEYHYFICSINARIMDDKKTKILNRGSYNLRKRSTYAVCI